MIIPLVPQLSYAIVNAGDPYRATGKFIGLAVMCLVVAGLSVAHHGHDVRERGSGAVVLVRVEEDTQSLEVVSRSEDGTLRRALLGQPHSEPITV